MAVRLEHLVSLIAVHYWASRRKRSDPTQNGTYIDAKCSNAQVMHEICLTADPK